MAHRSFETDAFPDYLKDASVTPMFKKGDNFDRRYCHLVSSVSPAL